MIKKILSIVFSYTLLGLLCFSFAQTQPWKKLQSPVTGTLRFLSFADSLNGWAAGEAGTIIRTADGGDSWEIQNSTLQTFIMDIFFADKNYGWALTIRDVFPFNSVLLKTTDGGNEWVANNLPDSLGIVRTIFFFDSLSGFAGGSDILYTSDGGDTWTEVEIDSNMVSDFPIHKFKFFNRQFGYACGGRIDVAGVVWKTTNYGLNWVARGISVDEIFDIFILDSLNAITLSGDPEGFFPIANIKTTDAGETWNFQELSFFGLSFAIDFRTYNEGWSASGYKFLRTTDHGNSWNEFETPDSTTIYDLQFTDARNGFAAGENGTIIKYTSPPDTSIYTPNEIVLNQNFPNPFHSKTLISYELPENGEIILKIFDILGKEVAVLVNDYKPAGKYEIEFDAHSHSGDVRNLPAGRQGLASGIYFYQMRVGEFVQTKKMVYLK
ncbi:MAG: T9SS type A sorting domain-containing protein [bacterium]|nr:T9SS type A sorting domain-containing protein [bacterium]